MCNVLLSSVAPHGLLNLQNVDGLPMYHCAFLYQLWLLHHFQILSLPLLHIASHEFCFLHPHGGFNEGFNEKMIAIPRSMLNFDTLDARWAPNAKIGLYCRSISYYDLDTY